jgi:hypothetical protein
MPSSSSDRCADHVALRRRHSETLLTGEEQVGLGLGARDVSSLDDDDLGSDAERFQRPIDLRPASGGCDAEATRGRADRAAARRAVEVEDLRASLVGIAGSPSRRKSSRGLPSADRDGGGGGRGRCLFTAHIG